MPNVNCMDLHITPLKRKLMECGLKNRWLAQQIGMDEASLSVIVNGKRKPSVDKAIRIARALDTTVEELWYWTVDDSD